MKSRFFYSNFSLIEFVRNKRSVSPLIKPLFTLRGWREEKCVYWNVSVALKCVWTSSILFDAKRGPLKTSVSKKTARSDDILRTLNNFLTLARHRNGTLDQCMILFKDKSVSLVFLFIKVGMH